MIWFTSDTHFGHENIIRLCDRPFGGVQHMNMVMIENWNNVVEPNDVVFHLGDVALGKIDESLKCVTQLNGTKFLVPGNHDRCFSGNRKIRPLDTLRYTDVGFTILPEQLTISIDGVGVKVTLCHFPFKGDHSDTDRYVSNRPKDNGELLIHGHVHNLWKVNERQINVGVDVTGFQPVSLNTILEIINDE